MNIINYLKKHDPNLVKQTPEQLFVLLDSLMEDILSSINQQTNWISRYVSNLLAWIEDNPRRKICSEEVKFELINSLITGTSPVPSLLKCERSAHLVIIEHFLNCADNLNHLYFKNTKNSYSVSFRVLYLESVLGGTNLYNLINQVKELYALVIDLRCLIASKFYRYLITQVNKYASYQNIYADELAHNYLCATFKAIDKYQLSSGIFKSYLDNWLKDARTSPSASHYKQIAYTVPTNKRKDINNFYTPIDNLLKDDPHLINTIGTEENPFSELVSHRQSEFLNSVLEYADPYHLGRDHLQI